MQEANRTSSYLSPNRPSRRHIVLKLWRINDKERFPKSASEKKKVTYKGESIRLSSNFSAEILQARREWNQIFKLSEINYWNREIASHEQYIQPSYPLNMKEK